MLRANEPSTSPRPRRSERVYQSDGQWYFHTREGVDVGPYRERQHAADEAARLARLHQRATRRAH
jgi:hypothetical protein